jgi:hypothetical protein
MLLDALHDRFFAFNEMGGLVWSMLCEQQELGDIAERIASTYLVPIDTVQIDVRHLLSQLERLSLVRSRAN